MKKLIPKSQFRKGTTADSIKNRIARTRSDKKNAELLHRCEEAWNSLDKFRRTRLRNFRYVFGDQWGDRVKNEKGEWVTERSRIEKRTGGIALQNNHLVKIVNTLAGLYAKTAAVPVCFARKQGADLKSQMMTNALQTNWETNRMKDLLISEIYEMICGGCPVCTEEWNVHEGVEDSYTYPVNPSHFFVETKIYDPRHWDTSLIGEIRDYTIGA